ncbi:hypothetical protein ACFQH8_21725 [Halomicroarcula sp. GCM10025710]
MSYIQWLGVALLLFVVDLLLTIPMHLSYRLIDRFWLKATLSTIVVLIVAAYIGIPFDQGWEAIDNSIAINGILMYGLVYTLMFIPASLWDGRVHGAIGTGSSLLFLFSFGLTFVEDYVGEQLSIRDSLVNTFSQLSG